MSMKTAKDGDDHHKPCSTSRAEQQQQQQQQQQLVGYNDCEQDPTKEGDGTKGWREVGEGIPRRRSEPSEITKKTTRDVAKGRSDQQAQAQQQKQQQRTATTMITAAQKRESSHRRRVSSSAVPSSSMSFFGNYDDSRYWDYAFRFTQKGDLGHHCRECRRPFYELNEAIAVRRGGRIELRYHEGCFSMVPDPRSQPASSANVGKFVETLRGSVAPEEQYRKMRTRGHW